MAVSYVRSTRCSEGVLMGAIGTCCCDPNCVDACEGVLPPTSVTLFPPFSLTGDEFELVEWDLTPIVDTDSACDTYQTSLVCAAETSWTMLRDIYCESDWPASNANDTAFALGTTHGCVFALQVATLVLTPPRTKRVSTVAGPRTTTENPTRHRSKSSRMERRVCYELACGLIMAKRCPFRRSRVFEIASRSLR